MNQEKVNKIALDEVVIINRPITNSFKNKLETDLDQTKSSWIVVINIRALSKTSNYMGVTLVITEQT